MRRDEDYGEGLRGRSTGGDAPATFIRRRTRADLWRQLKALLAITILVPAVATVVIAVPLLGNARSENVKPDRAASELSTAEKAGSDEPDSDETAKKDRASGADTLDVLVLGVDERPEGSSAEGSRTDTIMVARVFPESGQVRLLSAPRDLFVEIEPGVYDRINAAYASDGVPGTVEVLEEQFGISVDHHAVVNFEGFEEIVDTLGGVTLDVGNELPPGWRLGEGVQTLDGRHALLYARYRGTPGGDLDRIARQQQLVAALREQALDWRTLPKLPGIVSAVDEAVETDMSRTEAISLATLLAKSKDSLTSTQLEGVPVVLSDGRQVLLPEHEKNQLILQDFNAQ